LPADCPPLSPYDLSALPPVIATRMRLIPASSVGESRLMPALRPDCIVVRVGNQTRKADALVGFAPLSATPSGVDAIVPPSLLT
ncbi:MAG: sigma-E processing peptidase SpoIIGA, partial [Clostridia bacterium]|nr:sigma-E processing peptidase SpoIIGA [Clostridia bacterium]